MKKVLVINGHPDGDTDRLCAGLCREYLEGARAAGHEVRSLSLSRLDFPLLRSRHAFEDEPPPEAIRAAQECIRWCDHLVIVHPLWLGGAPALLKGFLEQVFRYGFALPQPGQAPRGLLAGRSARLIVTMGMPAPVYRLVFGGFGVRAIERGVLRLSGFRPVRHTLLGGVETANVTQRQAWLRRIRDLGEIAA